MTATIAPPPAPAVNRTQPTPEQIAKVTRLLDAASPDECWQILLASRPAS